MITDRQCCNHANLFAKESVKSTVLGKRKRKKYDNFPKHFNWMHFSAKPTSTLDNQFSNGKICTTTFNSCFICNLFKKAPALLVQFEYKYPVDVSTFGGGGTYSSKIIVYRAI